MIAALFVQPRGVYTTRADVDPWPQDRDARLYPGRFPVVAHPPCAAWGRYSKPTPESAAKGPLLGDDGGCFAAALAAVRRWGGVLEHPRDSKAWAAFRLTTPSPDGSWRQSLVENGYVCEVDQGHYGHVARKPTWLVYYGASPPPSLRWGPSDPPAIGSGARRGNLESLSKIQRAATPMPFADLLVDLAHLAGGHPCRAIDPDSECVECQIQWAEMVDDMSRPGANVRVVLPSDVAPWHDLRAFGATWVGDVFGVNGDTLDVFTPDGNVEPVPIEYCRPWRPGTYTVPALP